MKSKSEKYLGIAELIKDFVSNSPKEKLTFKYLTKLVLSEYPKTAWKNNWVQWRYHTTHPNGNYYDDFSNKEKEILLKIFDSEKYYDVVNIDHNLFEFCKKLINVAIEYEKLFGKKLNITGEIGEILICHRLGLQLVKHGSSTFDAIDNDEKRVQIKARRSETENLPKDSSTISRVSHSFDYLLLGILDRNYNLHEVWKAPYDKIRRLIEKQGKNTGPTISSIKQIGIRV